MLAEWGTTPEYIVNNWTDEELDLMVIKLAERKIREKAEAMGAKVEPKPSEEAFFRQAGIRYKKV